MNVTEHPETNRNNDITTATNQISHINETPIAHFDYDTNKTNPNNTHAHTTHLVRIRRHKSDRGVVGPRNDV